jgi:cathepsin B
MSLAELTKIIASAQPVNVNVEAYALTGNLKAAPKNPVIGIDILPTMNAIPINTGSVSGPSKFKALGIKLPENFTWNNYEDVKTHKGDLNLSEDWITPVYNQGLCGSCWAFAAASCLSDRFAIANKTKSPQFSPTYLLSCDNKQIPGTLAGNAGCGGGIPSSAFQFAKDKGIPSIFCQDYDWCLKNKACFTTKSVGAGADSLNKIIPKCQQSCLKCEEQKDGSIRCVAKPDEFKVYKADPWPKSELNNRQAYILEHTNASKTFFGDSNKVITEIKEELWLRGPVVACYKILQDFVVREKWYRGKTGLIYMNDRKKNYKPLGYHAVVIMGWGEEQMDNGTKLPYWIVKNSWGDHYADGGYFKYAMYNKEKDINTDINLDVPIMIDGGVIWCGISAPIIFAQAKDEVKDTEDQQTRDIEKVIQEDEAMYDEEHQSFFSKIVGNIFGKKITDIPEIEGESPMERRERRRKIIKERRQRRRIMEFLIIILLILVIYLLSKK